MHLTIIRDKKLKKARQVMLVDDPRTVQRSFIDTVPNHPNPQDYDLITVGQVLIPDDVDDHSLQEKLKFLMDIKAIEDGAEFSLEQEVDG